MDAHVLAAIFGADATFWRVLLGGLVFALVLALATIAALVVLDYLWRRAARATRVLRTAIHLCRDRKLSYDFRRALRSARRMA